jgi:histidinol phosphatase-like PHP family hydrolase
MKLPDLHIHTTFSDGELEAREAVRIVRHRHHPVGVADHLSPYHIMWDEISFQSYLQALDRLKCWKSAELCTGHIPQFDLALLKELDYLIVGVHALRYPDGKSLFLWDNRIKPQDPDLVAEVYIAAVHDFAERLHFDILAHPTYLPRNIVLPNQNPWTKNRLQQLIQLSLDYDFALEISGHWKVPGETLIRMGREAGVKFSTGSDGHSKAMLADLRYPQECIAKFGITEDELFMPARKL